jgi:Na+/melibiose symporter-like transporter
MLTTDETFKAPENDPPRADNDLPRADAAKTLVACVAGALIPGLGHALLRKWDRAGVFFGCIAAMMIVGVQLDGCLFDPGFQNFFSIMKFIANAGSGLFYWIPWMLGAGVGDPTAYTYNYANVFLYVAGLLNMLTVVDVFDITRGRKP